MILAHKAVGGRPEECIRAAVAVELLHNFTLVHDDIMDSDDWRRGRETVHRKWDRNVAILAGDGLLVLAYQSLLGMPTVRRERVFDAFTKALMGVCEGQALDKEFEQRQDVTAADYLWMVDKKTGTLLELAASLGALLAGASEARIDALARYGAALGRAFQLQDDLLEITSDRGTMGKSLGSDLAEGKKTFLLIHALDRATPKQRKIIEAKLYRSRVSEMDVREIRTLYDSLDVLDLTRTEIVRHVRHAQQMLSALRPDSRGELHLFADVLLSRTS